jgi:hypothetical protein
MYGSRRARVRRPRMRRAHVVAVAAATVLVIAIYAIVAVSHRAGATDRADTTHGASLTPAADPTHPAASPSASPRRRARRPARRSTSSSTTPSSTTPTVSSYEGSLLLSETGAGLASWQSPSTCTGHGWTADGTVTTGSGGNVLLTTTGNKDSCAALASPAAYSSAVIQAEIYFPASPGNPGIVANWDAFWLTDAARWPEAGELDAVETEPPSGVNAVSWHSGTGTSKPSYNVSTADDGWSRGTPLPTSTGNLTPGWHTVDIVYTKGFFAVFYDGNLYTSFTNSNVTGDPLTIYLTTDVDPQSQNDDTSPVTIKVQYLKVWSYK